MQNSQSFALDLPLKTLVWQDTKGDVWLGDNVPRLLKQRYDTEDCDAAFDKMIDTLAIFATTATQT